MTEQDPGSTAPTPDGSGEPTPAGEPPSGTPLSQQVGRAVMLLAAAIFAIFALVNAQYVDFDWVFGSTEVVKQGGDRVSGGVPLIVLLIAAFGLGAVVAWLTTLRSERRKRKRQRSD